jgi:hypothetical protein
MLDAARSSEMLGNFYQTDYTALQPRRQPSSVFRLDFMTVLLCTVKLLCSLLHSIVFSPNSERFLWACKHTAFRPSHLIAQDVRRVRLKRDGQHRGKSFLEEQGRKWNLHSQFAYFTGGLICWLRYVSVFRKPRL